MTTPTPPFGRRLGRTAFRRAAESVVKGLIYACGWLAIVILAAIAVFLINTFTHALVLGYLIYKTDNLWGAALYHMGMDLWLFVGPTTLSSGG
jgi:membrane protease YdiL (CAAX protease family)